MLSVYLHMPPINFWMPEPILMKHGVHVIATELISTVYKSLPPVYVYMCIPPVAAKQRLSKHVPTTIEEL
jgi:hypothetical protein